jgi:uncharacterized protein YeaO (DUF488 family)
MFQAKRVYESPAAEDGYRVLIDRLWPRGVSKDAAAVDLWLKEIAPSTELRKWFGHDATRWEGFCRPVSRRVEGNGPCGGVRDAPGRRSGA